MSISLIITFYLLAVFASFVMLKIYEKYSEKKLKMNKKTIMKILLMSLLCFINNLFMITILRTIFSMLLTFTMFKWLFKDDLKITLYYTIIITIILYIIDLGMAIFLPLGIKNIETLNQSLIFKVGYSIIVNVLFYFLCTNGNILYLCKKTKNIVNTNLFYLFGIFGIIMCNFCAFYLGTKTSDKVLNFILSLTELSILFAVIIFVKSNYENKISKIKEEQLKQNLDLYSKVAQEYRELKHNLMNDLLIIKTKVKKNDQELINDIINKYRSNYEWVNCITDIPEGIQGLIFLKKNQAELYNITFNIEYNIDKNVENTFAINKNFKLYEALGILFDNAIEAAKESKEKVINVVFFMENNEMHINILNTYNNSIDLNKFGNKDYSTKNRGSGIGLNYIKNQRNKFKVTQSIRDNIFITDITLNSKEKK